MKNQILCNVKTCIHNTQSQCTADTVEVGCDACIQPCCDHETLCHTFQGKTNNK